MSVVNVEIIVPTIRFLNLSMTFLVLMGMMFINGSISSINTLRLKRFQKVISSNWPLIIWKGRHCIGTKIL